MARNAGSTTIQRPLTSTSASTCLVREEESSRSSLRARSPPLTARFSKAFVAVPQTCSRAWKFRVSIGLRSDGSPTKTGLSWDAGARHPAQDRLNFLFHRCGVRNDCIGEPFQIAARRIFPSCGVSRRNNCHEQKEVDTVPREEEQ